MAKVVTGKNCVLSYVHLMEAYGMDGQEPKFSACVLIPKSDVETVTKIRAAIKSAYDEGGAKLKGSGKTVPPLTAIKTPLRDGDAERPDDAAYAGHWFLNANSRKRPQVVDAALNDILDPEEIYSGMIGRVSLNFFAYSANGNRGIGCGLGNVQKLRDGERLGGRSTAKDDFTTEDDESYLD